MRAVFCRAACDLVLGLLDRDTVDVVDLLADLVVVETVRAAGQREVIARNVDRRAGAAKQPRLDRGRQPRHVVARRRRALVALSHHHPAHVFQHRRAVLLAAARAHIDDAGLAIGILLQPDDLGRGAERVAGKHRGQELAAGVAEIGHGVERDVRHGLAEHDVENQEIVERRLAIADGGGENRRRLHGKARSEQSEVERSIACRHRARGGVADDLAEAKVLEEIAGIGLGHMKIASRDGGGPARSL
jgi:hypothetical protein